MVTCKLVFIKEFSYGDFPGSPVVKTPCFDCRGMGSIPGQGTKILRAARHGQKKKKIPLSIKKKGTPQQSSG